MRRAFNFIMGALLGGLVGGTIAILLTPGSGADLRQQIQTRAGRVQEEVRAAAAARRAELERQLAELRRPRG